MSSFKLAGCFVFAAMAARCQDGGASFKPKIQVGGALETDAAWSFDPPAEGRVQDLGFIQRTNRLRPTEATLSVEADLGRYGFRLDGGAGDFYRAAMSSDSWKGANQQVSQAYFVWKPRVGTRIEAGKFFSSVGAEVPQSYQDFNLTRSLLFWYAEPLYHVGVRASTSVGRNLTAGVQLLSGCNTVTGAHGHQTLALTTAWSGKRWGWSQIYMAGNEKIEGNGRRQLWDSVLTFNPWQFLTGYAEAIVAVEKRTTRGYDRWYGWAAAWKISPRAKWSFAPRLDRLNDVDGATTGMSQRLFEFTMTGEYRPRKFVIARLEYRADLSSQPFYRRATNLEPSRNQQAIVIGLAFWFQHEF